MCPDPEKNGDLGEDEDLDAALAQAEAAAPAGDQSLLVGEYDQGSDAEDIDIKVACSETSRKLVFPDKLRDLIHNRLSALLKLDKLTAERAEMLKQEGLSKDALNELRRQMGELKKLPDAESAKKMAEALSKKLQGMNQKITDGKESAVFLSPILADAYKLAFRQWKIFMSRDITSATVREATAPVYKNEPLYLLLRRNGVEADTLFSWSVYAVALESVQAEQEAKRKENQDSIKQLDERKQGLLGMFKKPGKETEELKLKLANADASHQAIFAAISRELRDLEERMVGSFWEAYTEAAAALVQGELSPQEKLRLRAFLRYGMISAEPWFLPEDVSAKIMADCADAEDKWNYSFDAIHIIYADECIELVAKGYLPPAIDEDLELNERLSNKWKADKAWRRIIYTHSREQCLRDLELMLREKVEAFRTKQAESEARKARLIPSAPDFKTKAPALAQEIQTCKVESARLERVVERIVEEYIPKQAEQRRESEEHLRSLETPISQGELARKEAVAIHRVARLCARLKDPFPPFALRDNFKPGTDAVHDRAAMKAEVANVEKADPLIFKDQLFPVKKADKRVYLRFAPAVILAPGCGFMGYSWCPRSGAEIGRVVVPVYSPRPGLRERLLHTAFSDFRWDTSKASAGVDLMTSETLVASYATARWDARKRSKPIREKMGIYSEESDRQNFRRHYSLYLMSAIDGGKRLFFKSPEVYDAILRYVNLPQGVERLKR